MDASSGGGHADGEAREIGGAKELHAAHEALERAGEAQPNARRARVIASGSHESATGPRVSVVIPTLNEALNLPYVIRALPDCVDELVIVDGLSDDGTPEVALALRPDAKIVYERASGKGHAMRSGFQSASGEIIVMLDADGSADPAEIPAYIAALLAGADFAKGSRRLQGGGSEDITRLRAAGNRALGRVVNLLFGTDYTDLCYGYNAFWRHCLPAMEIDCAGFEIETLINIRVARAGLTVREVASYERERLHGESNLRTFRDGGRVLRTILRERLRGRPLRLDVEAEIDRLCTSVRERHAGAIATHAQPLLAGS